MFKNIFTDFLDTLYTTAFDKMETEVKSDSEINDTISKDEFNVSQLKSITDLIIKNHLDNPNYISSSLNYKITELHAKIHEPMKIAIVGQFSSGKSTFLNALLSKNILPTGVTPVTSKINYIKYGESLKLKINFFDGREEFYDVNTISSFTDQRDKEQHDVAYLTLYYPLELLKSITFIDTPGLNSNSQNDTQTTENILNSADGIIWLTLVESAAKNSEKQVIEKYLTNYHSKSICIINQKDKVDEDELEEVVEYVEYQMGKYFKQIEAISSKQALTAKGTSKNILLDFWQN